MASSSSDDRHVQEAVRATARARDPDRYLAALLAPRALRSDLIALAAFSGELRRVLEVVREPLMGEIRLQWWRDALTILVRRENTGNPIADALGAGIAQHSSLASDLDAAIAGRTRELLQAGDAHAGREGVVNAEASLFSGALRILGAQSAPARAVCAQAGMAYGTTVALATGRLRDVPEETALVMQKEAHASLAAAREAVRGLGPRALLAFLPLVMVEPYLHALEQGNARHVQPFGRVLPLQRAWRLWRARSLGRI